MVFVPTERIKGQAAPEGRWGAWQIRTINTSMSRISSLLIEEDKENPKRLRNFGKMVGFPWLEVLFESSYCIPRG